MHEMFNVSVYVCQCECIHKNTAPTYIMFGHFGMCIAPCLIPNWLGDKE